MSDSGGAPGAIAEVVQEVSPAVQEVVSDVKDAVGQAVEQGAQAVFGTTITPQQIQKKEEDRQKQISEVRWKIQQLNKTNEEIERIRKEKEQKEKQKQQEQVQQEQQQQIQMQQVKAQQNPVLANMTEGRPELKKGVGG